MPGAPHTEKILKWALRDNEDGQGERLFYQVAYVAAFEHRDRVLIASWLATAGTAILPRRRTRAVWPCAV